jgi:hypothetical protein
VHCEALQLNRREGTQYKGNGCHSRSGASHPPGATEEQGLRPANCLHLETVGAFRVVGGKADGGWPTFYSVFRAFRCHRITPGRPSRKPNPEQQHGLIAGNIVVNAQTSNEPPLAYQQRVDEGSAFDWKGACPIGQRSGPGISAMRWGHDSVAKNVARRAVLQWAANRTV